MADDRTRSTIGVALKWVPLHVEVDPLSGFVHQDARLSGCSAADQAALEWALRLADERGADVIVACVGPNETEAMLRDAVACGAARAVRIDVDPEHAPDSPWVARSLALVFGDADLICCGDHSTDRGSGSVPGFLAAERNAAQALGLVDVATRTGLADALIATRRLDFGRREVLRVEAPAVLSFEGGTASLRRASLAAVLAAKAAPITVVLATDVGAVPHDARVTVVGHAAYRPRPRVLPAPSGDASPRDRILALTGGVGEATHGREVYDAEPAEAADLILGQLRRWGYLEDA